MKRLHVHVAVDDLQQSIRFYSSLFAAEPTVLKPDYAKWLLDDPRVNFAISARGAAAGLNHLGLQVESGEELDSVHARLQTLRAPVLAEPGTTCCYAKSDKYWVTDPQGIAWETFHTLEDVPVWGAPAAASETAAPAEAAAATGCCAPATPARGACC